MEKCDFCRYEYPSDLLSELASTDGGELTYRRMCAICGLETRNRELGLPLDTPFTGTIASQMYEDCVEWRKKHGR